jgi:hypothetical protein
MVADSERDANMLYAVGTFVPDPFIYLRISGRPLMVMSDLEIDRARAQAPHCRVASLGQYQQKLRAQGIMRPGLAHIVRQILREKGIRRVTVPDNFPLGLATDLEKLGIPVKARPGNFFPEREIKSAAEVRKISAALVMAEVGMAEAMQVLRTAKIGRDRKLLYHNLPLTSEKMRAVIDCAILQACGLAANTIVAGGRQACDPHERGYGPLRAHEPIIIDIFPRSQKPVTSATSPAPSCADAPVKRLASFTTPCCADKTSRSEKSGRTRRPPMFTMRCRIFLWNRVTKPDGATGAWKVSFTARATDSVWKSTNRHAWAQIPPANSNPATS